MGIESYVEAVVEIMNDFCNEPKFTESDFNGCTNEIQVDNRKKSLLGKLFA